MHGLLRRFSATHRRHYVGGVLFLRSGDGSISGCIYRKSQIANTLAQHIAHNGAQLFKAIGLLDEGGQALASKAACRGLLVVAAGQHHAHIDADDLSDGEIEAPTEAASSDQATEGEASV